MTGAELRFIRERAGLSLAGMADRLDPPISRQRLHRVEARDVVKSDWAARYRRAIATAVLDDAPTHIYARAASGRKGVFARTPTGYESAYAQARRWVAALPPGIERVSLDGTGWWETQAIIDVLDEAGIGVTVLDEGKPVRRQP